MCFESKDFCRQPEEFHGSYYKLSGRKNKTEKADAGMRRISGKKDVTVMKNTIGKNLFSESAKPFAPVDCALRAFVCLLCMFALLKITVKKI
ncbi:MAG TPA: hypothetical protein VLL97_09525 [Acidobacteriota bacterium]|nr:hypothetical protein [Acidobacteriota bacterium]